jgi:hypothetical protein
MLYIYFIYMLTMQNTEFWDHFTKHSYHKNLTTMMLLSITRWWLRYIFTNTSRSMKFDYVTWKYFYKKKYMTLNFDLPSGQVIHSDQSDASSNNQIGSTHVYTDWLTLRLREIYSLFDCTLSSVTILLILHVHNIFIHL